MKYSIPLLLGLFLLTGSTCQNYENTTGKVLVTTAVTVDKTMQGWASYVVATGTTEAQQDGVRKAYSQYQASMDVAQKMYGTYMITKDQGSLEAALNVLANNKLALLNLIAQFSNGKVK